MKNILVILSLFTVARVSAYSDISFDLGYSKIETAYGDKLNLAHAGLGGTFALGNIIFLGVSGEYTSLSRIIKLDEKVRLYKSQKEVRINPVMMLMFYDYILKITSKKIGYSVLKQKKDNIETRASDPSGYDITLLKMLSKHWMFGSRYSSTTFNKIQSNDQSIRNSANSITASFIIAYKF
jgi:hypothetical protein